jgi:hypothetical protein
MDFLTMLPGPPPPLFDRPFIEAKGHHNGLHRTAIGQQHQHQYHCLRFCFQPVENSALAHTEGFIADITMTPFFFEAMDADIATSTLSSCLTLKIRAKYLFEVHWALLLAVVTQKCAPEPRFIQIYPVTTL